MEDTLVSEIRDLYLEAGGEAFGQKLPFYERLRAAYDKAPFERLLQAKLGNPTDRGPTDHR
jgi:hypothetical protein